VLELLRYEFSCSLTSLLINAKQIPLDGAERRKSLVGKENRKTKSLDRGCFGVKLREWNISKRHLKMPAMNTKFHSTINRHQAATFGSPINFIHSALHSNFSVYSSAQLQTTNHGTTRLCPPPPEKPRSSLYERK
jgi:hypothetical protein